jgi:hypothetical protein
MVNNSSEQSIHLEKGADDLTNERYVNQIAVSSVAPFVPSPIAADRSQLYDLIEEEYAYISHGRGSLTMNHLAKYPVEKVNGPQWQSALNSPELKWGKETITFSFRENILVAIQVLEQLKYLWENFAVIIGDRNGCNIVLQPDDQADGELKWRVYQVDLEVVYDGLQDTYNIDTNQVLRERIGKPVSENIKNKEKSSRALSHITSQVLTNVTHLINQDGYKNIISEKAKQSILSFSQKWDLEGNYKRTTLFLDFENSLQFLQQLLVTEENGESPIRNNENSESDVVTTKDNSLVGKIKNIFK